MKKTLVDLLGRRYICNNKQEFASLMNLPFPDRRLVRDIKLCLRDPQALSKIKSKFKLAKDCSDNKVVDEIKRRISKLKTVRGYGLSHTASDEEVSKVLYQSVMGIN